ncbi:MAG: MauE/DoxX family redox-associated membrane protein [Planctomycetota bacterium]
MKWSTLLREACPLLAMAVLGCAGLAKAYAADDFLDSLAGWQTIPDTMELPIAMLLPSVEWGLLLAYVMLPGRRRATARSAIGLLALFAAMLVIESIVNEAPMCNCFGKLLRRERVLDGISLLLWRNLLLVALLAPAALRRVRGSGDARS